MPVQLNSSTDKLLGGNIDRATIIKMVDFYRSHRRKDGSALKFAHFTVTEIIELLVENGIIDELSPEQQKAIEPYGVKVYMANHANDPDTCPSGRETTYPDKDTVIICNTHLVDDTWRDLLDKKRWVSVTGAGQGVDKGTICPPDCPGYLDPGSKYNEDVSTIG